MSQSDWTEGLRLKLEEIVDAYVVKGARQKDAFEAIIEEVGRLRAAVELDPDPAEDSLAVIEEPTNDWPSSARG